MMRPKPKPKEIKAEESSPHSSSTTTTPSNHNNAVKMRRSSQTSTSSSHVSTPHHAAISREASSNLQPTTPHEDATVALPHSSSTHCMSAMLGKSGEVSDLSTPKASAASGMKRSSITSDTPGSVTTTVSGLSNTTTSTPDKDLIKVCVRVRPLGKDEKEKEKDISDTIVWQWNESSVYPAPANVVKKSVNSVFSNMQVEYFMSTTTSYTFDQVFGPEVTNKYIYESTIDNIVLSTMQGFHGSVFTYGQTASGKTFTMNGVPSQPGVIPQAVQRCFEAVTTFPDREFLIRVSYLEVYNEQIKDLLSTEPGLIKLQHDPKLGTVLTGVKEQVVLNYQQVFALIKAGEAHRHVGVTDMNEKSSRAHTLFKIIIESKERRNTSASPIRVSTLSLVDLAGSESAKMTNSKGERAREARHINQSLLTLSTIIQRLSEDHTSHHGKRTLQHLPFRDSKLTRLLENALDGNGKIAIICTISPTFKCLDETANTLKFASRAKMIQMSAKVNESVDDKTLLRAYREEIEVLRMKLKEMEEQQQSHHPPHTLTLQTAATIDSNDDTADNNNNNANDGEDNALMIFDEEQNTILQMVLEMERLILKADLTTTATTTTAATTTAAITPSNSNSSSSSHNNNSKKTAAFSASRKGKAGNNNNGSSSGNIRSSLIMKPGFTSSKQNLLLTTTTATSDDVKAPAENEEGDNNSNEEDVFPFEDVASIPPSSSVNTPATSHNNSNTELAGITPGKGSVATKLLLVDSDAISPKYNSNANSSASNNNAGLQHLASAIESTAGRLGISPRASTAFGFNTFGASVSQAASADSSVGGGDDQAQQQQQPEEVNGDAVILSVSKMLYTLKDYIAKSQTSAVARVARKGSGHGKGLQLQQAQLQQPQPLTPVTPASPGDKSRQLSSEHMIPFAASSSFSSSAVAPPPPAALSSVAVAAAPMQQASNNGVVSSNHSSPAAAAAATSSNGHSSSHSSSHSNSVQIQQLQQELAALKLDLRLKDADNQFLQDELENKDKMLTMLTEGLKEVEESQRQWRHANQELSQELIKERQNTQALWSEVERLTYQLAVSKGEIEGDPELEEALKTPQQASRPQSLATPLLKLPISPLASSAAGSEAGGSGMASPVVVGGGRRRQTMSGEFESY